MLSGFCTAHSSSRARLPDRKPLQSEVRLQLPSLLLSVLLCTRVVKSAAAIAAAAACCQAKPGVKLLMIGETCDGHDLNLLQLGTPGPGKPNVWIIARQHPGECMVVQEVLVTACSQLPAGLDAVPCDC